MTPHDDPYPEVRRLLDAVPAPAVRPVDVSAIHAAAVELQSRRLRRWKRTAGAAAALAAGVLVFALVPRLEVRAGHGEFAIRWGQPPADPQPPDYALYQRQSQLQTAVRLANAKIALLEGQTKDVETLAAAQRELKDLLLVVATDVNKLDESQKGSADHQRKLAAWVSAQLRDVDTRLAEVRKDSSAMYTLIADNRTHREGENR